MPDIDVPEIVIERETVPKEVARPTRRFTLKCNKPLFMFAILASIASVLLITLCYFLVVEKNLDYEQRHVQVSCAIKEVKEYRQETSYIAKSCGCSTSFSCSAAVVNVTGPCCFSTTCCASHCKRCTGSGKSRSCTTYCCSHRDEAGYINWGWTWKFLVTVELEPSEEQTFPKSQYVVEEGCGWQSYDSAPVCADTRMLEYNRPGAHDCWWDPKDDTVVFGLDDKTSEIAGGWVGVAFGCLFGLGAILLTLASIRIVVKRGVVAPTE